jgi:SAM-dependent methyltransferase
MIVGSEYGFPMDDAELDRIDFKHAQYHTLLDNKRFLAPISDNPEKILDLGCGTGTSTLMVLCLSQYQLANPGCEPFRNMVYRCRGYLSIR